jgi:hypothetical protein
MSTEALPERPGLRRAAMMSGREKPGRAVAQAEEAAKKRPERVSLRRMPQAG